MSKQKVKSFREWYDDEEGEDIRIKKLSENKRKSRRQEVALKRGDVDSFLEEDDGDDY